MSRKYKLVKDKDDDSPVAAVRRHLSLVGWFVIAFVFVLVVLGIASAYGSARQQVRLEEQRAVAAMTRAARPTQTPIPTPTISFPTTISNQTLLRIGPGLEFATTGSISKDTPVVLVGQDAGRDWYLLDTGAWVTSSAVNGPVPRMIVK